MAAPQQRLATFIGLAHVSFTREERGSVPGRRALEALFRTILCSPARRRTRFRPGRLCLVSTSTLSAAPTSRVGNIQSSSPEERSLEKASKLRPAEQESHQ